MVQTPQDLMASAQPSSTTTTGFQAPEGNSDLDVLRMADSAGVTESNRQAQAIVDRPQDFMQDMQLADRVPTMEVGRGTTMDPNAYGGTANSLNYTADTVGSTSTAAQPGQRQAQDYDTATATNRVTTIGQADAAQGEVRDEAIIGDQTMDVEGLATGTNADGSTNFVGEALKQTATQNISNVIDTSTVSGKILAENLGEGNYTDTKATLQGQLATLSEQFTGPNGEPTIPTWAAGTARNVSRIAAFKGMTGTAATAAMSQALMEASIPIAQQDAQFFQTMTQQNLDNRQQSTINTANVLSKMELANLDARMTAAVNNSKSFMQMDLTNLENEQQTEVVNTQARVQSILEDTKAENSARLFSADSENDFAKFYSQLNSQIEQFNSEQTNGMERFNAGEVNDASEFNSRLETQREQFYKEMQYNVDLSNARWRQSVQTANTEMDFQAAQTDVQNMFNISTESLSRVWDRADAQLDYAWKSSESDLDRQTRITQQQMQLQAQREQAAAEKSGSIFGAIGSVAGAILGGPAGSKMGGFVGGLLDSGG